MKKITLLVASIFIFGGIVANAADRDHRKSPIDFRNAEPIVFTERGIQFFVFADGQFDFNTRPSNSDLNYKSGRRNVSNNNYFSQGNGQKWKNGMEVEQDRSGKVSRIGNVFLSYDSNNRIKRIGTVNMDYNRFGLTQVGGLHIVYNSKRQIVDVFGAVNRSNDNQFSNLEYDSHNDYNTNGSKPNKAVATLEIRIRR